MAEELAPPASWSSAQTRAQFEAIAWLRYRIFINSFRRKGATGELVGRILIYLVFGSFLLGLVAGTGFGSYFLVTSGHLNRISLVLCAIFILCQILNIQLGQPGTTFDPTQLIRFPLRSRIYTAIRLFFGILTPANIVGTLLSLTVAFAITLAIPELWLYAFIAMAVFAATNVLFSRMVFAWVDRWLSTRRAREIFSGITFLFVIAIQWANFAFNPAYNRHNKHGMSAAGQQQIHFWINAYHHARPVLAVMPPWLTAASLVEAHHSSIIGFLGYTLACALFAAVFLAVFALRMATEFRGENFSDAANATPRTAKISASVKPPSSRLITVMPATESSSPTFGLPPVVLTVLGKEVLYLRRHVGLLYGLVMPILVVLFFTTKMATRSNAFWVFPAAVAYVMLTVGPLSYNSFGLEGVGSQFYFLAPVRMRDVILAKNVLNFAMALIEVITVFAIICYAAVVPSPHIVIATVLWAVGTLTVNAVFGNRRSLSTPKKMDPQRMSRRQGSQVSGFISLGIVAGSSGIASAVFALAFWLHMQWLLIPVFAVFAAGGLVVYIRDLRSLDAYALEHREELFLELCKQE